MSRSYKKTPIIQDGWKRGRKYNKRQASRKVRHYKGEISNGSLYKNLYNSWNIHDWYTTGFEGPHFYAEDWSNPYYAIWKQDWIQLKTYVEAYIEWFKYFKRK